MLRGGVDWLRAALVDEHTKDSGKKQTSKVQKSRRHNGRGEGRESVSLDRQAGNIQWFNLAGVWQRGVLLHPFGLETLRGSPFEQMVPH